MSKTLLTFTNSKYIMKITFTVSKTTGGAKMIKSIEYLRKIKNISQIEMAQKLNLPVSTYNVYENGNRKVPEEIARNIARILDVEVEDIFLPATFTIGKTKNHTA